MDRRRRRWHRRLAGEAAAGRRWTGDVFAEHQGDPIFLEQQRKGIEALEAECRRTGAFCTEARQARRRLEDLATD